MLYTVTSARTAFIRNGRVENFALCIKNKMWELARVISYLQKSPVDECEKCQFFSELLANAENYKKGASIDNNSLPLHSGSYCRKVLP